MLSKHSKFKGGDILGTNQLSINLNNKFWGVGPKAGCAVVWNLPYNFSIIEQTDLALLLGDLKTDYTEQFASSTYQLTDSTTRIVPHAALFLGLGYQYTFNGAIEKGAIKAGFEGNYIWNYIQSVTNGMLIDDGNFYTYGATIMASIYF